VIITQKLLYIDLLAFESNLCLGFLCSLRPCGFLFRSAAIEPSTDHL